MGAGAESQVIFFTDVLDFFFHGGYNVTYLSEEFLESNISKLLKHLIASNLSTALLAAKKKKKRSALLLTTSTTSMSVERSFSALKRVHTWLSST
jgi:predicted Zn-dependent peptidase